MTEAPAYAKLEKMLTSFASRRRSKRTFSFIWRTQPSQFGEVVQRLIVSAGLLHKNGPGWQRIVVEKPFGHDLASAACVEPGIDSLYE